MFPTQYWHILGVFRVFCGEFDGLALQRLTGSRRRRNRKCNVASGYRLNTVKQSSF